ncbi:MAG: radical SAM protein [Deltaproteobacteria bacterium]|nr:radical SAM protein [Deltaproteobacteria bacterium]
MCNARCLACGYWRHTHNKFLSASTFDKLLPFIKKNKLKNVTWSGGEPTLHKKLPDMMRRLSQLGIKNTLITNGITLNTVLANISPFLDHVILSLDAVDAKMYKKIRGVDCFRNLMQLPQIIQKHSSQTTVSICCLLQRHNIDFVMRFLNLAVKLKINSVAFLVPDLFGYLSPRIHGCSFGRHNKHMRNVIGQVAPTKEQIDRFEKNIKKAQQFIKEHNGLECPTVYVFDRYVEYFRNFIDRKINGINPRCPIPFNSVVITEDGYVKSCFFIPGREKITQKIDPFYCSKIKKIRQRLREDKDYSDKHCRQCLQTFREYESEE